MAKTEVYSWRVSRDLKLSLEEMARQRRVSVGKLLEQITEEWIEASEGPERELEQERLRAAAGPFIGSLSGGDPRRAEQARRRIRERLGRRHGRARAG